MLLAGILTLICAGGASASSVNPDQYLRASSLPESGPTLSAETSCGGATSSTSFGTAATSGTVTATGSDCYPLSGVLDDVLDIRVVTPSSNWLFWSVVNGSGTVI